MWECRMAAGAILLQHDISEMMDKSQMHFASAAFDAMTRSFHEDALSRLPPQQDLT